MFLTQFYGLVDVCIRLLQSQCEVWLASSAVALSILVGLIGIGAYRITRCKIGKKSLSWIDTPTKTIQEFQDATEAMGMQERLRCFFEWFYACRYEGMWEKGSDVARHWGFLLDRFSKAWWSFFIYKLLIKCYAAVAVNLFPGSTGGLMMMFVFFFDSLFSVLKSPYRDRWQASVDDVFIPHRSLRSWFQPVVS